MRGKSKVASLPHLVVPDPALAPDEDGLHLRGHDLSPGRADDAQLHGNARVGGHAAATGVPEHIRKKNLFTPIS